MDKAVTVIGGGPAGLSTCIRAAELGLRVVLYEKWKIGCDIRYPPITAILGFGGRIRW